MKNSNVFSKKLLRKLMHNILLQTVRIWNLENGKCLKHFHIGGTSMGTAVTSLSYDQVDRLIIGRMCSK